MKFAPIAVYGIGFWYLGLALFARFNQSDYVEVFCVPGFCYPAEPNSIYLYAASMILGYTYSKWGLRIIPLTVFAALLYDFSGSTFGPFERTGVYAFWVVGLMACIYLLYPFSLKANWFLPAFAIVSWEFTRASFLLPSIFQGWVFLDIQEPLLEILGLLAIYRTLIPK